MARVKYLRVLSQLRSLYNQWLYFRTIIIDYSRDTCTVISHYRYRCVNYSPMDQNTACTVKDLSWFKSPERGLFIIFITHAQ